MTDLAAFVLAGGKSSRMGVDKAFLQFRGKTLLSRALDLAREVTGEVHIVGPRGKFAGCGTVIEDVFSNCGPLGGIHAALAASSADLNLMLAVDLPFLQVDFLQYLIGRARNSSTRITVPRSSGRLHPLCSVYRRSFVSLAEEALRAGRKRMDALFVPADTLVIEETELQLLSFPAAMFDNLNTREEYERAKPRTEARGFRNKED